MGKVGGGRGEGSQVTVSLCTCPLSGPSLGGHYSHIPTPFEGHMCWFSRGGRVCGRSGGLARGLMPGRMLHLFTRGCDVSARPRSARKLASANVFSPLGVAE